MTVFDVLNSAIELEFTPTESQLCDLKAGESIIPAIKERLNGGKMLFVAESKEFAKRLAKLILLTGANINISERFTSPAYNFNNDLSDAIMMPHRADFSDDGMHSYDNALLHEFGHWSGHPLRTNRPFYKKFMNNEKIGKADRAEEEIVAELIGAQLSFDLGAAWSSAATALYVSTHLKLTDKKLDELLPLVEEGRQFFHQWYGELMK